jgi:hypothetical protein
VTLTVADTVFKDEIYGSTTTSYPGTYFLILSTISITSSFIADRSNSRIESRRRSGRF